MPEVNSGDPSPGLLAWRAHSSACLCFPALGLQANTGLPGALTGGWRRPLRSYAMEQALSHQTSSSALMVSFLISRNIFYCQGRLKILEERIRLKSLEILRCMTRLKRRIVGFIHEEERGASHLFVFPQWRGHETLNCPLKPCRVLPRLMVLNNCRA